MAGRHALSHDIEGGTHPVPIVALAGNWPTEIEAAVQDYRGHVGQIVLAHGGDRSKPLDPRGAAEIRMCTELLVRPPLGWQTRGLGLRLHQELLLAARLGKIITAWEPAYSEALGEFVAKVRSEAKVS